MGEVPHKGGFHAGISSGRAVRVSWEYGKRGRKVKSQVHRDTLQGYLAHKKHPHP